MKRATIALVLVAALLQGAIAQNFDSSRLDEYFNLLEKNNKFMGSVALAKDGKVFYTRSVGYADVAGKIRADEKSKYRIGSISKTFTTVLVMKGVEAGKINLDWTLDKYFPEIENAGKITIRQMLSHKSGIHSFTDDDDYLEWNGEPKTEKELIAIIAKGKSEFEPGSKVQYSNSNFLLLTYILEKSLGKPYNKLLETNITGPLGLKNTYLGGTIDPKSGECRSYSFVDGSWVTEKETDISIPLGAGGIVSTPVDLLKFSDALFGGKLITAESLEVMKTFTGRIGLGLLKTPFYDQTGFGHTGGIDGFSSVFSFFPEAGISYAMTCNGTSTNNNEISMAVLSAAFSKPFDLPDFTVYQVSMEELESYAGTYSSEQIPLKITVTNDNGTLKAQATGQSAFPLEATAKDKFRFEQAGIVMEFNPAEKTFLLRQGGGEFLFKKE